jgi:hypothetical protein
VHQKGEPAQRIGVRPLRVVDEQKHGAGTGEVDGEPVEPVQRGERVGGGSAVCRRRGQHAFGQSARARKQQLPLLAIRDEQ